MKTFRSTSMLALLLVTCSVRSHSNDAMTRLERIPEQGIAQSISHCLREHAWCFFALTAMAGYIYAQSVLDAMKPNPYEGPLKEAHQKIAELEAAMVKYEPLYKMVEPFLRLKRPDLFTKQDQAVKP